MTTSDPITELDDRFSDPDAVAIDWQETREQLERAELSWISTVRPDGHPHVTPLVSIWHQDVAYFTTGPTEQKALNLALNPAVVLTTGCNHWNRGLDLMIEGAAQRVSDPHLLENLAALWTQKWDGRWQFEPRDGTFFHEAGEAYVFAVAPTKILAFGKGVFSHTRHIFAD